MAARQQRDQRLLDHLVLAEDHLAQALLGLGEGLGGGIEPGRGVLLA